MYYEEVEEATYEDFLYFCESMDIEPRDEDEDWKGQYQDNLEYARTGEGYPTGLRPSSSW